MGGLELDLICGYITHAPDFGLHYLVTLDIAILLKVVVGRQYVALHCCVVLHITGLDLS